MKKLKVTSLLAIALFIAGCGLQSDVKILRLGHTLDTQHSVHIAMQYMADRVAELSDGQVQIQIYAGGVLGSERESLELIQLGSMDLTKVSAAAMEGFVEEYKVLGLPYIFRDKEHAFTVLDGPIGDAMLAKGTEFWLRGLCFYDAGARSFYTKDRIETPDDLRGLKIRVMQSITAVEMIRAMGGAPTPVSWGELYTALQGGVVDGAENNPPSFFLSRHYEVCKYYLLNEHTMIPDVMIVSTHAWNRLTEEEREWLQQAADESVVVQRKEWERSENEALAAVKAAGVEVIIPNKEPFMAATESVFELYRNNPAIYDLIQQIRAIQPEDYHVADLDELTSEYKEN
ncbi:TRAP transporter substrate-binding protein [Alkalitalea saponilacus]|uniref:Tripartite ATP-independent transporter solute receptor, DctP family n=1 Tax=Alkalitalea saponilacus TaxID=889453 RepID=A0A1T5G698_9BACT|nr:TRAP transporter substrate-binding protein [Alkalitalea saponilacus]ASB47871.1 TRAP transporter substrate-binding protein DctP [Alkalitalea saponilacus]SKC03970.1 tripartite ATP-independent transporter solute receptor, DctP family [Alkalitalea saponilacus]